MTKQKMIYDALGNPIPQHLDEVSGFYVANTRGTGDATGIDFSKIKMIYDALGNPIPQYFDVVEGLFKPITSDGSSGEGIPANHTHKIADVEGLDERLTEVFTQVSNGKTSLETSIIMKGGHVSKVGDLITFEELKNGIDSIQGDSELVNLDIFFNLDKYSSYVGVVTPRGAIDFIIDKMRNGYKYFCFITNSYSNDVEKVGSFYLFASNGTYIDIKNGSIMSNGNMYSYDSTSESSGRDRGNTLDFSMYQPVVKHEHYNLTKSSMFFQAFHD